MQIELSDCAIIQIGIRLRQRRIDILENAHARTVTDVNIVALHADKICNEISLVLTRNAALMCKLVRNRIRDGIIGKVSIEITLTGIIAKGVYETLCFMCAVSGQNSRRSGRRIVCCADDSGGACALCRRLKCYETRPLHNG